MITCRVLVRKKEEVKLGFCCFDFIRKKFAFVSFASNFCESLVRVDERNRNLKNYDFNPIFFLEILKKKTQKSSQNFLGFFLKFFQKTKNEFRPKFFTFPISLVEKN